MKKANTNGNTITTITRVAWINEQRTSLFPLLAKQQHVSKLPGIAA
jgi:hypothetical protein